MIKFSEVPYEDFKELVKVLKFTDEETESFAITKRLERFIENMSATESVFMHNIIKYILDDKEDNAKNFFDVFKETYPDKNFDPTGKLQLTKKDYFELELQTVDMLYDNCVKLSETTPLKKNSVEEQIINAKTLKPLIGKTSCEYPIRRALYFKNNKAKPLILDDFKTADSALNLIFKGEKNNVMGKFLDFIYDKKYKECEFFCRHFLTRVAVCAKDVNLEHPSNKEFYDLLNQIKE